MLHLCLIKSGLELVPQKIQDHPIIRKYARKRGKKPNEILLDISFHYYAMKKLKDFNRRGRPDIVHVSLLEALGSPLNKMGYLTVYVHTYDDKVIFIDPKTRIPRNYIRFIGLMEQLLIEGRVPPDSSVPLLKVKPMSIDELIRLIEPSCTLLLDEKGKYMRLLELTKKYELEKEVLVLVGGFQRGEINENIREMADRVISIYREPLETWIVISRILCAYELTIL